MQPDSFDFTTTEKLCTRGGKEEVGLFISVAKLARSLVLSLPFPSYLNVAQSIMSDVKAASLKSNSDYSDEAQLVSSSSNSLLSTRRPLSAV